MNHDRGEPVYLYHQIADLVVKLVLAIVVIGIAALDHRYNPTLNPRRTHVLMYIAEASNREIARARQIFVQATIPRQGARWQEQWTVNRQEQPPMQRPSNILQAQPGIRQAALPFSTSQLPWQVWFRGRSCRLQHSDRVT